MKIKIKDTIGRLYPLLVCTLLAGACSKSPQGEDESQGERSAIILTAGVKDSSIPVRADAAIPAGASASVWVYKRSQPDVPAAVSAVSPSVAGKKYTAAASGKLTPVDGENIYLEKGDYDIYSLGLFSGGALTAAEGTVSAGKSGQLANARDYIFVENPAVNIPAVPATKDISLTYTHAAARIVLELSRDDASVEQFTLSSVKMTPPVESASCVLDFAAGKIVPAASTAAEAASVEMDQVAAGSKYSYVMLPLASGQKITFLITGRVTPKGQAARDMVLKASYAASAVLEGGNSYVLKAKIAATGVVFEPGLKVEDWDYSPGDIEVVPVP